MCDSFVDIRARMLVEREEEMVEWVCRERERWSRMWWRVWVCEGGREVRSGMDWGRDLMEEFSEPMAESWREGGGVEG